MFRNRHNPSSINNDHRQEYLQGLRQFESEVRLRSLRARSLHLLDAYGDMLMETDDDEVLTFFEEIQQIAPNHARCHNYLAALHLRRGNMQRAVDHLEKAMAIDPDDRETVWNCGQVMVIAGEKLLARATYETYMRRHGYDEEMAGLTGHARAWRR